MEYSFLIKNRGQFIIDSNKLYVLGYDWGTIGKKPSFDKAEFPIKLWIKDGSTQIQYSPNEYFSKKEIPCKLLHYKQIEFLKSIKLSYSNVKTILKNGFYMEEDSELLNKILYKYSNDGQKHTNNKTG